jgi:hypothetical protein
LDEERTVLYKDPAEDVAADQLERRWFAAFKAASAIRAECEGLLDQMERIEIVWNQTRTRLARIEAIRDALGEELMQMELPHCRAPALADQAGTVAA